jgi:hypothetical protein
MEHIDQTPQVDPSHFTDSTHGDAMKIMHHCGLSRDLVAIESLAIASSLSRGNSVRFEAGMKSISKKAKKLNSGFIS